MVLIGGQSICWKNKTSYKGHDLAQHRDLWMEDQGDLLYIVRK
jgi:hypothetical protein